MLKLKKIAVTGGLAAGKTTVCQLFKELGAYVVSADEIVHQLLRPGTATAQQVTHLIGSDIFSGNELDRTKIAAKVFSHPDLLRALEKIIHPAVFDEIEQRYRHASQEKRYTLFVAEIPLLYETAKETDFNTIINVHSDTNLCRNRFAEKTHHSAEEFDKRMKWQMPPERKAEKATYTIENNGTLEQLKESVKALYSQLTLPKS